MQPPSADRLALLYRISQDLNSSLDLDEVLNRVIDEAIAAVRCVPHAAAPQAAAGQLRFRVACVGSIRARSICRSSRSRAA
jgi:hypothetical protein